MSEFNRLLFKQKFAEYICSNFNANKRIVHAINFSAVDSFVGSIDFSNIEHVNLIKDALGVKHVYFNDYIEVFISKNYPILNEMLLERKNHASCVAIAKKYLGLKPIKKTNLAINNFRERDTRRDWNTVK